MKSVTIWLHISQIIWLISFSLVLHCKRHSLFICNFVIVEISKWDGVTFVLVNLLDICWSVLFGRAWLSLLFYLDFRLFWGFILLCRSCWSRSFDFLLGWFWLFSWSRCWSWGWCLFLFLCCWLSFLLLSIRGCLFFGISWGSSLFFRGRVLGSFLLLFCSLFSLSFLLLLDFITCLFLNNFELFSDHHFSLMKTGLWFIDFFVVSISWHDEFSIWFIKRLEVHIKNLVIVHSIVGNR